MTAVSKEIQREDIERKFRELQGDIESAEASLKSYMMVVGAVAAVTIVGVAFMVGRRRGKKRSTVVEIRRI